MFGTSWSSCASLSAAGAGHQATSLVRTRAVWVDDSAGFGCYPTVHRASRGGIRPREYRSSRYHRQTLPTPDRPQATPAWRLDTDNGSLRPRSALDVLVDLNDKVTSGQVSEYQPVPLGFTPLDKTIGTGLRTGELLLIGGAQGTGKTTMALQMARNVASGGQANVLYICFEHDEQYLLNRLIAMESALAHLPHKTGAIKIQDVRKEILGTWMAEGEASAQMANNPRLRPSLDRIARYGQNLFLMRGSQTASTIDNIRKLVQEHARAVRRPPPGRVRRLPAEGARRSRSPRTRPRRSPTWSTASRTSPCPRRCRWSASWPPTRRA